MLIRILKKIDHGVGKLCVGLLFISVFLMISLTLANIVLSYLTIPAFWIEPAVRQLVFIVAFLGGAVATASKQHIAIDFLSQVTKAFQLHKLKRWIDVGIYIFCIVTLLWLTYAGYLLVDQERSFGRPQFLGIHSSTLVTIIPVGTLLIAFRFFNLMIQTIFEGPARAEHGTVGHDTSLAQEEFQ